MQKSIKKGHNMYVIVIGASSGGFKALSKFFSLIDANLSCPILLVQHLQGDSSAYLADSLNNVTDLKVFEAIDKMEVTSGNVYVAPGGYHLMLEENMHTSLSVDARVAYSRPSIDVLFNSVATICRANTIGIILTGANADGADGAQFIKQMGGKVIVQDPKEAESEIMPRAVIDRGCADHVLRLDKIADYINTRCQLTLSN